MTDAPELDTIVIQDADGGVYAVPVGLLERYAIDPDKVDEVLEQAGGDDVAGFDWTGSSFQLVGQYSFSSTDAMKTTYLPGDQFVAGQDIMSSGGKFAKSVPLGDP